MAAALAELSVTLSHSPASIQFFGTIVDDILQHFDQAFDPVRVGREQSAQRGHGQDSGWVLRNDSGGLAALSTR